MTNLKIDPELRDLLPPLSKEKFEGLEKMILEEGYDGTPILIWNGYIVDGHHRYSIFKKHNIEFNTENISLPKDCDKSDVMEWMITYQDVRRNMCDAEKIYATDKVYTQKIKEWNKKRILEGSKNNKKREAIKRKEIKERNRCTNTREQRAKLSGVSTGTINRYDVVMRSNDEDLKHSMLSGNIKIGTAYKIIKDKETKKLTKNIVTTLDVNTIHLMLAENLNNINKIIFKDPSEVKSYDDYENLIKYLSSYIEEIIKIKSTLEKKQCDSLNTIERVEEIINQYGYTITGKNPNNLHVECVETLLNMDQSTLNNVFDFIHKIFPYQKCATYSLFIKAITYFLKLFSENIDMNQFKKTAKATKLRKLLTPEFILLERKNYAQYKNEPVKQTAYALAIAYQSRVKNSKLPFYKFDM